MSRTMRAGVRRLPSTLVPCAMLLAPSLLRAQSDTGARSIDAGAELAPAAARADFDVLRRALEEAHGGIARFSTRAELDRRMAAHRARLDRPMTRRVLAGILAEAIAELRDGHARLELDSVTSAALAAASVFPLRVQLESDRLMVQFNDSPGDSTIRPGMELLRINGRPVADIVRTLLPRDSRNAG